MQGLKRLLLPLGGIIMTTGFNSAQIPAPSWILSHAKSPRHPLAGTERPKERVGPRITGNQPSPISQSPSSYKFPSSRPALFSARPSFARAALLFPTPTGRFPPPRGPPLSPASPFLSALYKQSASVSGGRKVALCKWEKANRRFLTPRTPIPGLHLGFHGMAKACWRLVCIRMREEMKSARKPIADRTPLFSLSDLEANETPLRKKKERGGKKTPPLSPWLWSVMGRGG